MYKGYVVNSEQIHCDNHNMISSQLSVLCHVKKTAPCAMFRGSATSDHEFAYLRPSDSSSVYRYAWCTEEWSELPPCPCKGSALVIIDGALTAVGGWIGSRDTNCLLTLRHKQWVEELPPMKSAHFRVESSVFDGENLLVIVGQCMIGHNIKWITTVQLFHMRSRKWHELPILPQPLVRPSATICRNQVHVTGICGKGFSMFLHALPSSDQPTTSQYRIISWSPLPPLPVTDSTVATFCGQLVIIGGKRGGSLVSSIHQLVDRKWVEIGSMSSRRCWCLVVSPSPDKMMIVGGQGDTASSRLDSVEECVVVK